MTLEPLFPDPRLPTILRLLRGGAAQWQALGITRVRVFGAAVRGQDDEDSDLDLLLNFAPQAPVGLLALMRARAVLGALLGRRAEVVTEAGLHPALRAWVLREAVDVFADPPPPRAPEGPEWRWRVGQMLELLDRVQRCVADLDPTAFRADPLAQDAALHLLTALGETSKFIPQAAQDAAPAVPWELLRDVRNLIAHDEFGIDPALVWHTARVELPALRPALAELAAYVQARDERPAQ